MRGSNSPFRVYANCLESFDSFALCGVVIMGFWIQPKYWGYGFG
jgi:hypothetical protein